jgi:hypothetical protein
VLNQNNWWARKDLNLGPMDYESTALTAELRAHCLKQHIIDNIAGGHNKNAIGWATPQV